MLDNFWFIAWTSNRVNFVSHKSLTDLIFTRSGHFLLVFSLESDSRRFEDRIWSRNLQNFDIFGFTRNYDFLAIRFDVNVVGTDSRSFIFMLTERSEFRFHASERNESFWKFTLFLCKWFICPWTRIEFFPSLGLALSSKYKSHLY